MLSDRAARESSYCPQHHHSANWLIVASQRCHPSASQSPSRPPPYLRQPTNSLLTLSLPSVTCPCQASPVLAKRHQSPSLGYQASLLVTFNSIQLPLTCHLAPRNNQEPQAFWFSNSELRTAVLNSSLCSFLRHQVSAKLQGISLGSVCEVVCL